MWLLRTAFARVSPRRWIMVGLVAGVFVLPIGLRASAVLRATNAASATGRDPHTGRPLSPRQTADLTAAVNALSANTAPADLVAAGKMLFQSTTLPRRGESCATCHSNGTANPSIGTINHPRAAGDFTGPRDPISLIGVGLTAPYRWQGDIPTLEAMVTNTVVTFFKDGPTQPQAVTATQVASLMAYLNTIAAPQTPFDLGTLSPAALRGQVLFQDKGQCMSCHGGPLLTDNKPHVTGVPSAPGATDHGNPGLPGSFNTTALRDIKNSAPYMHNGFFTNLRQVVEFYNSTSTIAPLHLTPSEIDDLVAYLNSL